MSFEKYEDFLELFAKQLVIQSRPISLGQMCECVKNKHIASIKVCWIFFWQTKANYAGASLVQFHLKGK